MSWFERLRRQQSFTISTPDIARAEAAYEYLLIHKELGKVRDVEVDELEGRAVIRFSLRRSQSEAFFAAWDNGFQEVATPSSSASPVRRSAVA